MTFMLDTNVCIALIRQRPRSVLARLKASGPGPVAISAITLAELEFGAAHSSRPDVSRTALEHFVVPFQILPFGASASRVYGYIRAHLQKCGTPIAPLDTLIAAHALSIDLTLVTNNHREFVRVPGLRIEDWLADVSK
jgi:tRNA(fMet)-specific endonuclease VapC